MEGESQSLLGQPRYRLRPSEVRARSIKYGAFLVSLAMVSVLLYVNLGLRREGLTPQKVTSLSKKSSSTPNIVFVLADDVGYGTISSDVTPFMQSLKDDGISLETYYSQESCTPARAALLTGRYPLTVGVQFYEQGAATDGGLPDDETTIANVLADEGYTTYMLGKWNLGNAAASQLPTSRGFNYYLGFLDAYSYYWSKRNPDFPDYKDFMYADNKCYYQYDGSDIEQYSTSFFQNAAVASIEGHDFDASPMFLYVAFQSARAPFEDTGYSTGLPDSYMEDIGTTDAMEYIQKNVEGSVQQQYFKSVAVMDLSVAFIYFSLEKAGQLDNTYFIFASDNGGCPTAGGRNYPLRGTKGSLFEGGTKVEAFIYNEGFSSKVRGQKYTNMFHVSDWFPTILDMAGVKYSPKSKYALDGVSHLDAMVDGADAPRSAMLYNYYYDPSTPSEDLWNGKAFAVRNERYKLMHTFDSPMSGAWYGQSTTMAFDDDLKSFDGCAQFMAQKSGTFTYFLFDLQEDPNENVNLYGSSDKYKAIQDELYSQLDKYSNNAAAYCSSMFDATSEDAWKLSSNYVVPWQDDRRRLTKAKEGHRTLNSIPSNCGMFSGTFLVQADLEKEQEEQDALMTSTSASTSTTSATATDHSGLSFEPPAEEVMTSASATSVDKPLTPFQSMTTLMQAVQTGDSPEPEGNGAHLQAFGKMEKIEKENSFTTLSHTSRR